MTALRAEATEPVIALKFNGKDILIHPEMPLFTIDGERIHLRPAEFTLLTYLAKNRDRVCGRDEIRDAIVKSESVRRFGDSNILDVTVSRLRKVFETKGASGVITTIRKRGYKFAEE